jgi:hypothetical protein
MEVIADSLEPAPYVIAIRLGRSKGMDNLRDAISFAGFPSRLRLFRRTVAPPFGPLSKLCQDASGSVGCGGVQPAVLAAVERRSVKSSAAALVESSPAKATSSDG